MQNKGCSTFTWRIFWTSFLWTKDVLDYNHNSHPFNRIITLLTPQDFHDRKSCDENTSSLDQTIISCPSCCIAIAKGDGCNTVFCVCGKQFSWEAEKESLQRSSAFVALYSSDTSEASAQVIPSLFLSCPDESNLVMCSLILSSLILSYLLMLCTSSYSALLCSAVLCFALFSIYPEHGMICLHMITNVLL